MKNYNFDFNILPDNAIEILTKFDVMLKAENDNFDPSKTESNNDSLNIEDFVYNEIFNREETNKEFEKYLKECFKGKTEDEQKQMLVEFVRKDFFDNKVDIFLKFRDIYYNILTSGTFHEMREVLKKEQVKKKMLKDEHLKSIYDNIVQLAFMHSLQFVRGVTYKNLDNLLTKDKGKGSTK